MKFLFNLVLFCLIQSCAIAQVAYTISGTVKNEIGEAVQSATVFIAGSEKITATNADGSFVFNGLKPGGYELVVNMLGYGSVRQTVTINDRNEVVKLMIQDKKTVLNEIIVGAKKQSPKDLKKFTRYFLGPRNTDPEVCRILNPELINFVHTDTALTATSDDFLVVENRRLGYRVKYLLKSFYCKPNGFHFFDGDFTFEALEGTPGQQNIWNRNRRIAYEGSPMQFLRALYNGTTRKEGYLVYRSTTDSAIVLEPNPSDPQQFVAHTDSNFVKVNIKPMVLVVQDREKAAKPDIISNEKPKKRKTVLGLPYKFTLYKLAAKVDSRGSITDRKFLYFYGYWGIFGVGDQLPFEYNPE